MADKMKSGEARRRAVLGDAHVDASQAAMTAFDEPFQTLVTQSAWGTVWDDDTIPSRERSMLTLAILAATGNTGEIPMHVRATARTGASPDDIMQVMMHVAIYAGVPRANTAIRLARDTLVEMGHDL